jgi:hypothetical protein
LFLLFILLFHQFWNHSIFYRDSFDTFAPLKYLIAQGLKQGRVWLWYPWQYLGVPFVGNIEAGWFYPLNVIFLVFPFEPAFRIFVLVHYPMAALFMDLFLRGRGLSRNAALLGGLAFALSGYMVSMHGMVTMLAGAAWAPLALYCFDRAKKRGLHWAVGAGAVLAVQVFGGEPQAAAVTAAVMAFMGIGSAVAARGLRPVGAVALAGLSSIALSAAQLLPAYDLLSRSVRAGGVSPGIGARFSFHPARLIELVWPTPYGVIWPEVSFWARFAVDTPRGMSNVPWSLTAYLGLPLVFMAAIGLAAGGRRWRWPLAAGMGLFLLLSLGHYTPVYDWFHEALPGFNLFRYPEKYMAWFSGFAAVAAAVGFEKTGEAVKGRKKSPGSIALIYMAAVLVIGVTALFAWPALLGRLSGLDPGSDMYQSARSHLIRGGIQWLCVNLAAGGAVFLWARNVVSARIGPVLLILVLAADWWLANVSVMPAGGKDIYDFEPRAARAISPEGRPRLGEYRIYRQRMVNRDASNGLKLRPLLERQAAWARSTLRSYLDNMEGFENILGYSALIPTDGKDVLDRYVDKGDLLGLYNVNYVILPGESGPIPGVRSEEVEIDPLLEVSIYRLPDALPRAYWVGSARQASDGAEARAMLKTTDFRKQVIVVSGGEAGGRVPGDQTMAPAEIRRYEPDEVVIECDAPADGWLVLSDRYYPGWKAWVDRRPAEILRANVLVRAVRLEKGRRVVRFSYQPAHFRAGAWASLSAWSGALVLAAVLFWKRRGRGGD